MKNLLLVQKKFNEKSSHDLHILFEKYKYEIIYNNNNNNNNNSR